MTLTDNDLDVKVTMTTTEHGNVKVSATPVTAGPSVTDNTLYGNLEIATATLANNVITPTWTGAKTVPVPAGSGTADQKGTPVKDQTPSDGGFTLNKAVAGTGMNAGTMTPTYAAFRIRGTAVLAAGSSTGGDTSSWLENDLADVVVAFSFETVS